MSTEEHKKHAPKKLTIGILSISSTRTLKNDESGNWIHEKAEALGHDVLVHMIVTDDARQIKESLYTAIHESAAQLFILTGGTGVSPKDVTIEAVKPLFTKELTGFAVVFAQLSYNQIGSAAIVSRTAAGLVGKTAVFCIPGSVKACKLACEELIFPEARHIVKHALQSE